MRAIIKQLLDTNAKCEEPRQQLHRGGRVVETSYVAASRAGIPQRQQQQQPKSTQQPQEGLAAAKPMMEPFDLAPPKVSLLYLSSMHVAFPLPLTLMIALPIQRTEFLSSKFPPGIRHSPAAGPDAVFTIVTR